MSEPMHDDLLTYARSVRLPIVQDLIAEVDRLRAEQEAKPEGWRLTKEQHGAWQLTSPSGAHAGWVYDSSLTEFRALLAQDTTEDQA